MRLPLLIPLPVALLIAVPAAGQDGPVAIPATISAVEQPVAPRLPEPAIAPMRLERLLPGTTYLYRNDVTGPYSLKIQHDENGGYILEQRAGADLDGPLMMTIHTDAKGQWLRQVGANGQEIRFEPHNCSRALGYCEYTALIDGEADMRMAYEGTLDGNILSYRLHILGDTPQLLQSGTTELDEDGMTLTSSFTRDSGGPPQTIELVERIVPSLAPLDVLPQPSIVFQ